MQSQVTCPDIYWTLFRGWHDVARLIKGFNTLDYISLFRFFGFFIRLIGLVNLRRHSIQRVFNINIPWDLTLDQIVMHELPLQVAQQRHISVLKDVFNLHIWLLEEFCIYTDLWQVMNT